MPSKIGINNRFQLERLIYCDLEKLSFCHRNEGKMKQVSVDCALSNA